MSSMSSISSTSDFFTHQIQILIVFLAAVVIAILMSFVGSYLEHKQKKELEYIKEIKEEVER